MNNPFEKSLLCHQKANPRYHQQPGNHRRKGVQADIAALWTGTVFDRTKIGGFSCPRSIPENCENQENPRDQDSKPNKYEATVVPTTARCSSFSFVRVIRWISFVRQSSLTSRQRFLNRVFTDNMQRKNCRLRAKNQGKQSV